MLSDEPQAETRFLWNDVDCNSPLRGVICEVRSASTPVDGCVRDTIGAVSAFAFCAPSTYDDAISTCARMDGLLVRDFRPAFHEQLVVKAEEHFGGQGIFAVFLGADDRQTEDTYVWLDGGEVPPPP
jgi:hypothetical protein